jgi:RimJ/RimL family protein N-acetyltransferase
MSAGPVNNSAADFNLSSASLRLRAQSVPWDREVFGFAVAEIRDLQVIDSQRALRDYADFQDWLDVGQVRIVSSRLPHDQLRESMFLEANGFRFVEMVLHPTLQNLQSLNIPQDDLLVTLADVSDLSSLQDIAEHAFRHERYHVDPRLDPRLGDLRYGRWVKSSLGHPVQRLLKITDGERLVALFLVESRDDRSAYWHLTAVSPTWQGTGYGYRVWQAMLRYHQTQGCESLMTTISARNVAVLNLYAKLGFRFRPPEMTFHWVREEV